MTAARTPHRSQPWLSWGAGQHRMGAASQPCCSPKVPETGRKTGALSFMSLILIVRVPAKVPKALVTLLCIPW